MRIYVLKAETLVYLEMGVYICAVITAEVKVKSTNMTVMSQLIDDMVELLLFLFKFQYSTPGINIKMIPLIII